MCREGCGERSSLEFHGLVKTNVGTVLTEALATQCMQ